jgi:hypothetical protein
VMAVSPPPEGGMNGDDGWCRLTHTMDVSVDLANATHYDSNDASCGFSIWTEDDPGSTTDWFFVLPNVYGFDESIGSYNGIAIRISHGLLIDWDGRGHRHGTSIHKRPDPSKHVYGTFFAAKSAIVRYGARMARKRAYDNMVVEAAGAVPVGGDTCGCLDPEVDLEDVAANAEQFDGDEDSLDSWIEAPSVGDSEIAFEVDSSDDEGVPLEMDDAEVDDDTGVDVLKYNTDYERRSK